MFLEIVQTLLALILTGATAAALYLGLFRAGGAVGLGRKLTAGLVSGAVALAFWSVLYSNRHLGW